MPESAIDLQGTVVPCTTDAQCPNSSFCVPPPAGIPGDGTCYVPKNRYISINPNPANAGLLTARRVSVLTADGPVVLGWVGAPELVAPYGGKEPGPLLLSRVVGAPFHADWIVAAAGAATETVHLGDCHIAPQYTYLIQAIQQGVDDTNEANFSEALALKTVDRWGDIVGPLSQGVPSAPNCAANWEDVSMSVLQFFGVDTISAIRLEIADEIPSFGQQVGYTNMVHTFQAFEGLAYPFSDPCTCAGLPACPPGPPPACQPSQCGNGTLDPGEQCDVGDAIPGDGCDAFCQNEGVNGATMELVPVGASGPHTIIDNQIILESPGQRISFDLFLSNWDPSGQGKSLGAFQTTLDCAGFDSGFRGTINPVDAPCGFPDFPEYCIGIDGQRQDYVFEGVGALASCNSVDACSDGQPGHFACGAAELRCDNTTDDGTRKYGATFAVEMSADALGVFALGLDPDPARTFMREPDLTPIAPITIIPAIITVSLDCNGNGIIDHEDISTGTSLDCNTNAVPDECEPGGTEDCNGNGISDLCDLFEGASQDCNANAVPDQCEPLEDCNANGVQDFCDIIAGTSSDCTANSIPDECEPDCNGNTIADSCDIAAGFSRDCNASAVPDECEPPLQPVQTEGPRSIAVTPPFADPTPMAVLITGDAADAGVACVSAYVQADGTLAAARVFQSPDAWCTVHVHGDAIIPSADYNIQFDNGTTLNDPSPITTAPWGDVNNDSVANFSDIQLEVLGFQGDFNGATVGALDLAPCDPNGSINFGDIQAAVLAFQGGTFATFGCNAPCAPGGSGFAPPPRGGAPAAWLQADRRMVIFGGMAPITGDTFAYDADTNVWSELAPQDQGPLPSPRCHHTLVSDGGISNILMFGGFSFQGRFNDVWQFDPVATVWTQRLTTGAIPIARCLHAAALVPARNEMLVYGGVKGGGVAASDYFQDTHILDVAANDWANVNASGPGRRRGPIAFYASADDAVYLWGGKQVTTFPTTLWRFDLDLRTWQSVATGGDVPTGREDPTWFWNDASGKLYIFSGRNDNVPEVLFDDGYVLDLASATWQQLSLLVRPEPRWRATVAFDSETSTGLMFGGWSDFGGNASFNDTWRFDASIMQWTLLAQPAD